MVGYARLAEAILTICVLRDLQSKQHTEEEVGMALLAGRVSAS